LINSTYTGISACKTTTRVSLGYTSAYQINVNGNEALLRQVIANYGPVTIGMWSSSLFGSYRGGIFYDSLCPVKTATVPQCDFKNVNHGEFNKFINFNFTKNNFLAMVITGYDTINGTAVWKVRNSWGNLKL
jgi:hypothetical protein